MSSRACLTVIAVWVLSVQARDDMLVYGWVPEPQGRGTWSILWSCLSTIFICTWSALHLNVPKHHGRWYLFFRKIKWMLIAAAAPEVILAMSAQYFFAARDLSIYLVKRGHHEWTLTQTQFAWAGGFWTRTPQGEKSKCSPDQLRVLIENNNIDGPSISDEELNARGKSDWVVKLIAVLQIIWFVVQTLFRAIQHYQITALEIMTVAFVFCSVFTYGFSLYRPQDVEYPVVLEMRNAALATGEATQKRSSNRSNHAGEQAESTSPTRRLEKMRSGLPRQYISGWADRNGSLIILQLFACGFGAIHCLAWNSLFPSSKERLAWRICSATTTALPTLAGLPFVSTRLHASEDLIATIYVWTAISYIIGRATLIVFALPSDAFQTVNWNAYIPHFAA